MKPSYKKRVLSILMALALMILAGCGSAPVKDGMDEEATDPVEITAEQEADAAGSDHTSLYVVEGTTEESIAESFASDTPNANAVLVQSLGVLTMSSADINKTGDSSGDSTGGQNAAVAVLSKGQLTLNQSNITTNALGAAGLVISGEGTQMEANETSVYTSGKSSPAIIVREDASAMFSTGTLSTEGADSPCIQMLGGRLTLSGTMLFSKSGETLSLLSGDNFLTLDQTKVPDMADFAEEATLELRLSNKAAFTGALGDTLPARANVYLDATSVLTLTGETYLGIYVNADTTHANIQSGGFNLYYDSNAPENAYLNGQSFLLPGGGFLAPII